MIVKEKLIEIDRKLHDIAVSSPLDIIDIIATHKGKYVNHPYGILYIVISRSLEWRYVRNGHLLIAEDHGFYDFMAESPGSTDAFGGARFDLKMKDGSITKAHGQIWSVGPPDYCEPIVSCGVASLIDLARCYVFGSTNLSEAKLKEWLSSHETHEDYFKYDPRQHPTRASIKKLKRQVNSAKLF